MSQDTEGRISVLEERVANWMSTTSDYRKQLCEKIAELKNGQDKIFCILDKLPCDKRSGYYQSISRQMKFIWGVVAGIVLAIIKEWAQNK